MEFILVLKNKNVYMLNIITLLFTHFRKNIFSSSHEYILQKLIWKCQPYFIQLNLIVKITFVININ